MLEEMRGTTKVYVERLLTVAVTLCEYAHRKTVRASDVVLAARLLGRPIYR